MKKVLTILFAIPVLAGVVFFGFKGCESFRKTQPETETTTEPETVVATEKTDLTDEEIVGSYHSAFINANIDFTCQILKNEVEVSNQEDFTTKLNSTYSKYDLPTADNGLMIAILEKFQNDTEVQSIVKTNTEECKTGGEATFY